MRAPALYSTDRVYRIPPAGSLVLVLGDLGCLSAGDQQLHRQWVAFGRRLGDAGCRPVALLPFPPGRCHQELRFVWEILPWERSQAICANHPDRLRHRAERLLRLVSPALRIEPGFLRAVRLLLPSAEADAGTEADVWRHPAVRSTSAAGATLDPEAAKRLRADFADEPAELQRRVLAVLRVWRGSLPQEIWFEEIQCLSPKSRALLPEPGDLALARHFFEQLSQRSRGIAPGAVTAGTLSWYKRAERRLTDSAWSDSVIGKALHRLSWALHEGDVGFQPQAGFSPTLVPSGRIRRLALRQIGPKLQAEEQPIPTEIPRIGSALASLWSGNGLVQVQAVLEEPPRTSFWEGGESPSWADSWGWDDYGAWATFSLSGKRSEPVIQRLRWIEPGIFLMGSPDDGPGRWEDEGPRHEVRIKSGFWLFDTPCTQALWAAVMGENPSEFQSPDRPVEGVSWEEVQAFVQRVNEQIPGLDLVLPSEAQWEHACRAGTETALYTGPIEILGERNAPALDSIAWYGGNSGVDFELQKGWDSSDWLETQYPNPKSGTHPVKRKQPNAWGLYDMLGNVEEWVQDAWHGSYDGAPVDGSVWESDDGAARVIRGGSWLDYARFCRSAYRVQDEPVPRYRNLGFRCARAQGREPGKQGEAAERRQTRALPDMSRTGNRCCYAWTPTPQRPHPSRRHRPS